MLRNIVYSIFSIFVFFIGVILYGFILRSKQQPLNYILSTENISFINNPKIIIDKRHYKLKLYDGVKFLKNYNVVLGKNSIHGNKNFSIKDNVTPTGQYKICSVDTTSEYHIFFKIDFPNERDAANALMDGTINKDEYLKISKSHEQDNCLSLDPNLYPNIGIEGIGKYNIVFKNLPFIFNWTNGSIAVSNEDIEELYAVVKVGTIVIIK